MKEILTVHFLLLVSLLIAIRGFLAVEGCVETNVDFCTDCVEELLSNATDVIKLGGPQNLPSQCVYPDYYDDRVFSCIYPSSPSSAGGENLERIINVYIQPFFLVPDILPDLQEAMVEHASEVQEPLCGVSALTVKANENVADPPPSPTPTQPPEDTEVCFTEVLESNMIVSANTSVPPPFSPGWVEVPLFQITRQSTEYVYLWDRQQTRYTRLITQMTCVVCPGNNDDDFFKLHNPNDVNVVHDEEERTYFRVHTADGTFVEITEFLELDNGSFITCGINPDSAGAPLSSNIPRGTAALVSISLLSLLITLITYCVFSELKNLAGKIIINFIVALSIAFLCVLFDVLFLPDHRTPCVVGGVVFHYFWLAAFVWMNALSISTTRAITTMAPVSKRPADINKKLARYMMYGWGAPAIVVAISLILHFCNCTGGVAIVYGVVDEGEKRVSCFIGGDDIAGILLFTGIVGILLGVNVILFVYTLYTIRKVTKGIRSQQSPEDRSSRKEYLIFIKLSILMGLPWILHIPAEATSSLALEYIYVILNSLQGFFVFIVLVVSSRARPMWKAKMHKMTTSLSSPTESHHQTSSL